MIGPAPDYLYRCDYCGATILHGWSFLAGPDVDGVAIILVCDACARTEAQPAVQREGPVVLLAHHLSRVAPGQGAGDLARLLVERNPHIRRHLERIVETSLPCGHVDVRFTFKLERSAEIYLEQQEARYGRRTVPLACPTLPGMQAPRRWTGPTAERGPESTTHG